MIKSASQSGLTTDIKYRNMGAANVPSNEYLIETIVVGATPAADVTFTNLSQWAGIYRHLQVVGTFRSNAGLTATSGFMRFNGDTGNNYALHTIEGNGSSVLSGAAISQNGMIVMVGGVPGGNDTVNKFATGVFDVLDAYRPKNKTVRALQGMAGTGPIRLNSGLWMNTSEVSSITFYPQSGSWVQGSRFSLYGVTA